MAKVIGIMGESGAGKTTSMRNLDPKTTFYIDCDKKGLSWKGWREQYNNENKNYLKTDDAELVLTCLKRIDKEQGHIKTVVVDTLNGIMVAEEMKRMKQKNYDKWQDMAQSIFFLVDYALIMREDITVILIVHSLREIDEDGYVYTRIKTSGKKLRKIELESKMTTVLHAVVKNGQYLFETKANNSTAKTPMGAFAEDEVENDIVKVLEVLKEF